MIQRLEVFNNGYVVTGYLWNCASYFGLSCFRIGKEGELIFLATWNIRLEIRWWTITLAVGLLPFVFELRKKPGGWWLALGLIGGSFVRRLEVADDA